MLKKMLCIAISLILVACNKDTNHLSTSDKVVNDTTTTPSTSDKVVNDTTTLKVLNANVWNELTHDADGRDNPTGKNAYQLAIEELRASKADVIFLEESGNTSARLAEDLNFYYWQGTDRLLDVAILSRYPIKEVYDNRKQDAVEDRGGNTGVKIDVNGRDVIAWANHLDYTHYTSYDARGANGVTWGVRDGCVAITDANTLEKLNRASKRIGQIQHVIDNVSPYIKTNTLVLVGGDFNEPSGLDWGSDTLGLYDHKAVFDYTSNKMLRDVGLTDSYRELFPNPVTHPGITWPYTNSDSWTRGESFRKACGRDLDDRDRIDFIYYNKTSGVKLVEAAVIGPYDKEFFTSVDGQDYSNTQDVHQGKYIDENGNSEYAKRQWPSDHLWYQATFKLSTPNNQGGEAKIFTPQLENIRFEKSTDGINIHLNLVNLITWDNAVNYGFEVVKRFAHPTTHRTVLTLTNKPKETDDLTLHLTESEYRGILASQEGLQIRFVRLDPVGYHKLYAVKTFIPTELRDQLVD